MEALWSRSWWWEVGDMEGEPSVLEAAERAEETEGEGEPDKLAREPVLLACICLCASPSIWLARSRDG